MPFCQSFGITGLTKYCVILMMVTFFFLIVLPDLTVYDNAQKN